MWETGLLHGCLRFMSWPCADTTAAGTGHSDVTLPQCLRETKQDRNEALVLQTSLGEKATSLVTLFTVYTANYRKSFSGASLCTLGSLVPSAPSRALHLTNNFGPTRQPQKKPPPPPTSLQYSPGLIQHRQPQRAAFRMPWAQTVVVVMPEGLP